MDHLQLHGMAFFGRHGALPAERELGQRFAVDVDLEVDTRPAAASGRLADTVDYRRVRDAVAAVVEGEPLELLESVAGRIADRVLEIDARIDAVTARVAKRPPLPGEFAEFAVVVQRRRGEA